MSSNNALTMNPLHGAYIMGRSGLAVLEKMVKGDSKLVSASKAGILVSVYSLETRLRLER